MKEGVKKSISLILVLTLLVQLLPVVAFGVGDETNDLDISTDSETVSMKDDDAEIVGEEDALREESVKHFRLRDGGYMLVEYETAVHYQTADGSWEEIDNTLQKTGQQYVAQAGDMTRKFAASLDSGFLFETAYQGQSVSMSLARRSSRDVVAVAPDVPAAEDVLFEMLKLADSLRNLCGIQLTENHHGGQCWIRGAYLQTRSMPLNDYQYLMQSFKRIEKMQNEKNRCAALHQLNLRQDPGDGNQFCAPGTYEGFSHVSVWHSWEEDPGYLKTPFIDHSVYTMVGLLHEIDGWYHEFPMPLTWALNVTVQYGTPLEMTFTGLDPEASYGMKVFYPNSFFRAFVGQTALKDETLVNIRAGKVLLADRIAQNPNGKSVRREIEAGSEPFWEYDLPKESYQDGTLKVRWEVYDTLKALAVSEVWIMKKE